MDTALIFAQLFSTFFVIGLFTIGGGYAMLSLIQTQVVTAHAWMTESEFTNIVAISQMTPGPIGVNCSTFVGYEVLTNAGASHLVGILGSAVATFACVLPSFMIVLMIVKFYEKVTGNPLFEGVMSWLRPVVAGLIGAAALILIFNVDWSGTPLFSTPQVTVIRDNFIDWKSWALFGAAMVASLGFKANPILIILGGGIAGLLLY
jgi:chromate transporter